MSRSGVNRFGGRAFMCLLPPILGTGVFSTCRSDRGRPEGMSQTFMGPLCSRWISVFGRGTVASEIEGRARGRWLGVRGCAGSLVCRTLGSIVFILGRMIVVLVGVNRCQGKPPGVTSFQVLAVAEAEVIALILDFDDWRIHLGCVKVD